jgi:hypothetical protein
VRCSAVRCSAVRCSAVRCIAVRWVFLHTGCPVLHRSTPSDIRPVQYGCVAVFLSRRDTGRADVATCDHCGESVDTNSVAAWSHLPSNFDVCEVCFMNRSARDPWEVSEGELLGKPTASVPVSPPSPCIPLVRSTAVFLLPPLVSIVPQHACDCVILCSNPPYCRCPTSRTSGTMTTTALRSTSTCRSVLGSFEQYSHGT